MLQSSWKSDAKAVRMLKKDKKSQNLNQKYTFDDHIYREEDSYAIHKYKDSLSLFESFGLQKSHRILNVGCGAGDFTLRCHENGYISDGFDSDMNAIALAKSKGNSQSIFQICDYKNSKKYFETYKFITCHDVMEHVSDDKDFLENITENHMSKDSLPLLTVPAHMWLFGVHDVKLGHFRRYSKKQLEKLVSSKLEVIYTKRIGFFGVPLVLLYSKLLKKPYPKFNSGKSSTIITFLLKIESFIKFPFSTSLLIIEKK